MTYPEHSHRKNNWPIRSPYDCSQDWWPTIGYYKDRIQRHEDMTRKKLDKWEEPPFVAELRRQPKLGCGELYTYHTRFNIKQRSEFAQKIFLLLLEARIRKHGEAWYEEDEYGKDMSPEQRLASLAHEVGWYMDWYDQGLKEGAEDEASLDGAHSVSLPD